MSRQWSSRLQAEVKVELRGVAAGKPTFHGRACPYDSWSNVLAPSKGDRPNGRPFKERFAPGAFDSSLAKADVIATWNHNPHYLLGRTGSGTLRLTSEKDGLYVECDRISTTYADDLQKLIDRGDIDGMSFQFLTIADDVTAGRDYDEVVIKQAHVREVSFVTRPAYPASAAGVRAEDGVVIPAHRIDPAHLALLRKLSEM